MSVQKNTLQFISLEKNDMYNAKDFSHSNQKSRQKRQQLRAKRRKKQLQRKLFFTIALSIILFCSLSYVTNHFAEFPFISRNAQIEYVKKQDGYPEELLELLEKNEETYDFVKNYAKREKYMEKSIDLSEDYKAGTVPLLMQWDKRWGYDLYGDSMIGLSACGPTCMTMAYLYFTGDTSMNPRKMAEYAQEAGYHSEAGTSWSFWTEGTHQLSLYGEELPLDENAMKAALDNNKLIVCSMSPGDFTDKGHYILLRGYDENGFFVNDPNRKENSEKQWDYETLMKQMKNLWALGAL